MRAADTVPRASRGWDNAKKDDGRKRHIAVDATGLVLAVVTTAASVQDRDATRPLLWNLSRCCTGVRLAWADAGIRRQARHLGRQLEDQARDVRKRDAHSFDVLPCRWSSSAPWPRSPRTAAAPATTNGCPKATRRWSP